jgi:hypothetical protein
MDILVACEESQAIANAFRKRGHRAFSCDLKPCSGGHPEYHMQRDCTGPIMSQIWDIIIFHPECRYMCVSGNAHYGNNNPLRASAVQWTCDMWELIKRHSLSSVLENPVSVIFKHITGGRAQYVQPYHFGENASKKTGLYLRNLPRLIPTLRIRGRMVDGVERWDNQTDSGQNKLPPSEHRSELRSKTYLGISDAMAEQWGKR